MSPALHRPDPPLRGDRFAFRAFRDTDAPDVVVACTDPDTQRFIPILPRPYTLDDALTFIASADEALAAGSAIQLAVADPVTDRLVGAMTLRATTDWHWYVGYWTMPAERRRGTTAAALTALTRWAFATHPDLERISLYTDPENRASQRVAETAGFTREGRLRAWDRSSGAPEDVVMFSLIRADLSGSGAHEAELR